MNRKIPTIIAITIILISAILAGGFIYWRYFSFQEELSNQSDIVIPEKLINETTGWNTYTNDEYRFEIKYPNFYYIVYTDSNSVSFKNEKYKSQPSAGGEFIISILSNLNKNTLVRWF